MSYLSAGVPGDRRVIFVHGTPGSAKDFRAYLESPPENVELISVDRLGFGASMIGGRRKAVGSFAEQAAALGPLMTPAGAARPILVGHSLGGPIVAEAAADFPDRVGAIVILAGSLNPDLEHPEWYNYIAAIPPLPWLIPTDMRIANDELFASPRQTRELAGKLANVRCPVVIVHGEKDELVPVANVEFMQRAFKNAAAVVVTRIPGASHFIPWTHEAQVRAAIAKAIELAEKKEHSAVAASQP